MKKLHPNFGVVTVLDEKLTPPSPPGLTWVQLESGEKRHVTTEWLKDVPAEPVK